MRFRREACRGKRQRENGPHLQRFSGQGGLCHPLVNLTVETASNWANNQINRFTVENHIFRTRTWGIHVSMKIQKTMREGWVYMTLLDKGKEEWSIRFQKWDWAVHGYFRKSKTHVAGKFLLGN